MTWNQDSMRLITVQRGSGVEVRRDAPVGKPSFEPSRDHGKEGEVGDSH